MLRNMSTGKKLMIVALISLAVIAPVSAALATPSDIPNGWCKNPKNPHFALCRCFPTSPFCRSGRGGF